MRPTSFWYELRNWLAVLGFVLCLRSAEGCTTFCLSDGSRVVFGRNYDYFTGVGRLTVNRRGLAKTAFDTRSGFRWVSRFGSVTFDQFGCEFPTGGVNEAGLVVELMLLEGTQYPDGAAPTLIDLQWIQYQLDSSATVAEVLASERDVRILPGSSPLHFLVADRTGRCATIEFLNGRRVVHVDETLAVAALTNSAYADALAYSSRTDHSTVDWVSSLGRFVHAADAVQRFQNAPAADAIAYAFDTLESIQQPNWTRWNVVYDLTNLTLHFRSDSARTLKHVRLADLDFSTTALFRVADLNDREAAGENLAWRNYSPADNLAVVREAFRAASIPAPATYLESRAAYPDSVQAATPLPLLGHPRSETMPLGATLTLTVQIDPAQTGIRYQWMKGGAILPGANATSLQLSELSALDAGDYRVITTSATRFTLSRAATVVVAEPTPSRLANLSVRSSAGLNGQPLIVGFVSTGGAKQMLVRAVGPTLARFDVQGLLSDPTLAVHQWIGTEDRIADVNDNWHDAPNQIDDLTATCSKVGAFALPEGSRDAMIMLTAEGPRTVHVASASGRDAGIVLVEAYDADLDATARLVNVSARNPVRSGAGVLIAGFVISGNSPKRLLIRGLGPALARYGVSNPLIDPQLELHRRREGVDEIVATNDNWRDEPGVAAAAAECGAGELDSGSRDAALVFVAPAGVYTAIVSGVNSLTGEGLVEVFDLP